MVLQIVPEMNPEDLEKILNCLPEPNYVKVSLYGDFDYSAIYRQAEETMPGVKLQTKGGLTFELKEPSKETILDIYKKSYSEKELPLKERSERSKSLKNIILNEVGWYLDDSVNVKVTPTEVDISYKGKEPDYITQLREEVSEANIRLNINVNK